MSNAKIIFTFSDEYINIYIYKKLNSEIIPLYKNSILNNKYILNGFILDVTSLVSKLREMIDHASQFIGYDIKAAYIGIDINKIKIKDFELLSLNINNGVFDERTWEYEIKPNMKMNKASNEYTYDNNIFQWVINNKIINEISGSYKTNSIDVKGKVYQINKIIYDTYITTFNKIGVEIIDLKPLLYYFNSIPKKNNNEIFISINNDSISVNVVHNNNLIKNVNSTTIGLNSLYSSIKEKTSMTDDMIDKYLAFCHEIYNSKECLSIINLYGLKHLELISVTQKDIENVIMEYIRIVSKFIDENVEYLNTKNISINHINLITENLFIKKVFNNLNIYSQNTFNIFTFDNEIDFEQKYLYSFIMAKNISKEDKEIECLSKTLTYKDIKELKPNNISYNAKEQG